MEYVDVNKILTASEWYIVIDTNVKMQKFVGRGINSIGERGKWTYTPHNIIITLIMFIPPLPGYGGYRGEGGMGVGEGTPTVTGSNLSMGQ